MSHTLPMTSGARSGKTIELTTRQKIDAEIARRKAVGESFADVLSDRDMMLRGATAGELGHAVISRLAGRGFDVVPARLQDVADDTDEGFAP